MTEDREKLGLALCPFCGGPARFGKCVPGELPASRVPNLLRRVERARRFPDNTCPASRHVHMMAKGLLTKRGYGMLRDPHESEHCAVSLLSVLESLWKARTRAVEQQEALRWLHDVCKRMDAERQDDWPTEEEYQAAMAGAAATLRHNVGANRRGTDGRAEGQNEMTACSPDSRVASG